MHTFHKYKTNTIKIEKLFAEKMSKLNRIMREHYLPNDFVIIFGYTILNLGLTALAKIQYATLMGIPATLVLILYYILKSYLLDPKFRLSKRESTYLKIRKVFAHSLFFMTNYYIILIQVLLLRFAYLRFILRAESALIFDLQGLLRTNFLVLTIILPIFIRSRNNYANIQSCYYTYNIKDDKCHRKGAVPTKTPKTKLRIAFFSDVHLNYQINPEKLKRDFKKVAQHSPDIVIGGGDFVDLTTQDLDDYSEAFNTLKECKPKYGIYAVPGNHDYYFKSNLDYITKTLGLTILRDKVLSIDNIDLIFRDDETSTRKRLSLREILMKYKQHHLNKKKLRRLSSKDKTKQGDSEIKIVVDHSPSSAEESLINGAKLQLSGHTHGGQMFPLNFFAKFIYPNTYGLKQFKKLHSKALHTIVSSGIGSWLMPYRSFSKSEFVILDIIRD